MFDLREGTLEGERHEEKWVKLFWKFLWKNVSVFNPMKVTELIFSLPGTSVPVAWLSQL